MKSLDSIDGFLRELSPLEQYFKKQYLEKGRLMTYDELAAKEKEWAELIVNSGKETSTVKITNDDLRHLMFDRTSSMLQMGSFQSLKNNKSFLIQRQVRYGPTIITDPGSVVISYVYDGSGEFLLEEKQTMRAVQLKKGDFLLLSPPFYGCHRITSDDCIICGFHTNKNTLLNLISRSFPKGTICDFYEILLNSSASGNAALIPTGDDAYVISTIKELVRDSLEDRTSEEQDRYTDLLMSSLLVYIQKYYGRYVPTLRKSGFSYSVTSMYTYLEDHYSDFDLQAMADFFSYSKSYLSRCYRAKSGYTISESLQRIRMKQAEYLLRTSDTPVENIAFLVGYKDVPYFIEVFRKRYQTTPYQYRKSCAGPPAEK